jgi:YbbR domain-containing protein
MTKLIDIIFRNWQAKIMSLLLAMALWMYVGVGQTRNAFFPGNIPLQIKNVPQGLVAVTDVDAIKVKVVASPELWKSLSADSFTAYLDLGAYKAGTSDVKVTATCNVSGVQIVETDPATVLVSLEPRTEKEVPVNVLISGNAGEGLVAGQWQVAPQKVQVSGAKSIVESLLEATAKITLSGQTADFKENVALVGVNSQGQVIKNLDFTPAQVTVTVPIVKASNVKTVGIKANIQGSPADGYWISQIETDPQTVTIAASEAQIVKINYILTSPIDISGINKTTTVQANLQPDSGMSVLDKTSQVKVIISVSKSQSAKEIETGFQWENLPSNLKVTSVDPATVKVVVNGPQDKLANLISADISLIVNLSIAQNPGTYSIDISRSNIAGPTGVSVSSIVPSAINVRVDTK